MSLPFRTVVLCFVASVATQVAASDYALDFDGQNDFAVITDAPSLDMTSEITVEAWVKLTTAPSRHMHFVSKNEGYGSGDHAFALQTNGYLRPYLFMGNICLSSQETEPLYANEWIHLAGTFDGEFRRFFINGLLVREAPCDEGSELTVNGLPLLLGKLNNFTQYFHGTMDEVRVWNVARTQFEIQQQMYRQMSFSETVDSNLVGYWRFRGGSGQVAKDYSLYANDAVRGSGPSVDANDPSWVASDCPAVSESVDTVLVLEQVQAGVDVLLPMLSYVDVHVDLNPSTYDFNDYPLVMIAGNSASPAIQSDLRAYLQNGGNLILFGGAPYYLAGSTSLNSVSDIVGAARYGNIWNGHVIVEDGIPFGMLFGSGDTLAVTGPTGGGMAKVYNPTANLENRVFWQDGSLYGYSHRALGGDVVYLADFGAAWSPQTERLFAAAVDWLLGRGLNQVSIVPDPDTLHVFEQFLISQENNSISICIGPFAQEYESIGIEPSDILINDQYPTELAQFLSDTCGFEGSVLRVIGNRAGVVSTYGYPYGTTTQELAVHGVFADGSSFDAAAEITLVGHRSGDLNRDGFTNITDLTILVAFMFEGDNQLSPELCDVNDSGQANVSDIVTLVRFVSL